MMLQLETNNSVVNWTKRHSCHMMAKNQAVLFFPSPETLCEAEDGFLEISGQQRIMLHHGIYDLILASFTVGFGITKGENRKM